eukprot:COSAG05_NODE_576_length_8580_cov_190.797194_3_plen_100_part_00
MLDIAEADEIAAQLDAAEGPKVASMLDETPMEQQLAKRQWAKRMGVLREQERLRVMTACSPLAFDDAAARCSYFSPLGPAPTPRLSLGRRLCSSARNAA